MTERPSELPGTIKCCNWDKSSYFYLDFLNFSVGGERAPHQPTPAVSQPPKFFRSVSQNNTDDPHQDQVIYYFFRNPRVSFLEKLSFLKRLDPLASKDDRDLFLSSKKK